MARLFSSIRIGQESTSMLQIKADINKQSEQVEASHAPVTLVAGVAQGRPHVFMQIQHHSMQIHWPVQFWLKHFTSSTSFRYSGFHMALNHRAPPYHGWLCALTRFLTRRDMWSTTSLYCNVYVSKIKPSSYINHLSCINKHIQFCTWTGKNTNIFDIF